MAEYIKVKGAREHNLKNVDVNIPKNQLVVITGLSGSGKSSLAFDTIYAEGQRRYVESLSSYARQFLGMVEKPDVDSIEGLSPAISIDQKSAGHNPRSTVGTVTEIYDYLRLLFARVGHPHCPNCGIEVKSQSIDQIVENILQLPHKDEQLRIIILAPIIKGRKGEYDDLLKSMLSKGYARARIDGKLVGLDEDIRLERYKKHTIEIVIDRLIVTSQEDGTSISRISDSIETALKLGEGEVIIAVLRDKEQDILFSENFSCPQCGLSIGKIEPHTFSFNSPHGACPACNGLGSIQAINTSLTYNPRLTIAQGGISYWSKNTDMDSWNMRILQAVGDKYGFSLRKPLGELSKEQIDILMQGTGDEPYTISYINRFGRERTHTVTFQGLVKELLEKYQTTDSIYAKKEIEKYITYKTCPTCHGAKLNPVALGVRIGKENINDVNSRSITTLQGWIMSLDESDALSENEKQIAKQILKEIRARLQFLSEVGLDYLTLNRTARTLSGGESQRIRLASQIGSGLSGVLYVLDEPSIGLHQKDNAQLLVTLQKLRALGNSVVVVEHDDETMRLSDWIIDMGPGAGEHGGNIIAQGTYKEILHNPQSVTGKYLSGEKVIFTPSRIKKKPFKHFLTIEGAKEHNLKNITVKIPLGAFTSITGVSGSGKSTLINDILYPYLSNEIYNTQRNVGKFDGIDGLDYIDKVIQIDQSPIGRTPRSNPVSYIGAFTIIRELLAQTQEAKMKGFGPGRFSFNVKGGRCEQCKGDGMIKIEMQFLPDIYVTCDLCKGKRYNKESLNILYKGKNIYEILSMTVEESLDFFKNIPSLHRKLQTLSQVGLGYIRLGQSATTLSGGEAQRVKLAEQLSRKSTGKTVYILDEPTTGLHFADIDKLLEVLHQFVAEGNTVIVIEHNIDVIRTSDWIVDLGPDGGDRGGNVVIQGTIDDVMHTTQSYTGKFLKEYMTRGS